MMMDDDDSLEDMFSGLFFSEIASSFVLPSFFLSWRTNGLRRLIKLGIRDLLSEAGRCSILELQRVLVELGRELSEMHLLKEGGVFDEDLGLTRVEFQGAEEKVVGAGDAAALGE